MSDWMNDTRQLSMVKLAGNGTFYRHAEGDRFFRFERPGEFCMLPWLRVFANSTGRTVEASLNHVELMVYADMCHGPPCEEVVPA